MFFILSKLLIYLIYPLTWIILLLLFQLIAKSPVRKRNLRIAALIIFLLFSNAWLLNMFAHKWDAAPVQIAAGTKYSCAIVLGGFSGGDRNQEGYFNAASDRFLQAVSLYQQGKVAHILISGGNGNLVKGSYREGAWAAKELLKMGIPGSAILIENKARNTLENGIYTKQILDSVHLKPPYVLITSAFHMPRSLLVFQHQNTAVIPYPCNYIAGKNDFVWSDLIPQTQPLDVWTIYIKEVVGYVTYYIKSKI